MGIRKKEISSLNRATAIMSKHGSNLPSTYNRGSKPIDEIFVSSSLKIKRAGYLAHGATLGDHRPIWIDVDRNTVIGCKGHLNPTFATRRLKTQDPRVVQKYLQVLSDILHQHNVEERAEILLTTAQNNLSPTQIQEYEDLDRIRETAMIRAENQCRQLKMGAIQWSPVLQQARDKIMYFSLSLCQKVGCKVSTKII